MREKEEFLRLLLECLESGSVDEALGSVWERYRRKQSRLRGENA